MTRLLSLLILCVFPAVLSPAQTALRDISSMVKIDASTYLIVNDKKAGKDDGARLGILVVRSEAELEALKKRTGQSHSALSFSPLDISNWPPGAKPPSDLEAVCAIPGQPSHILTAESGYYKDDYGRIFRIKVQKQNGRWSASYISDFEPFRQEKLDYKSKNKGTYTTPRAKQIEGMACLKYNGSQLLLMLARVGAESEPTTLVWGDLDFSKAKQPFKPIGEQPFFAGYQHLGSRGASDLYIPGSPGPQGELWAVATNDESDVGAFSSVIYRAGYFRIRNGAFSVALDRTEPLWKLDGLKVEGVAGGAAAIPGSVLSIGTDDENFAAVWRPLMPQGSNERLLMATLWVQTAAECRALYYQAFNMARKTLDEELQKPGAADKKRAVVVDIDETVLDNSPYQANLIFNHKSYPNGWKQWVEKKSALALPGAVEFLQYAVNRGVDVFYVSNRKLDKTAATLQNLSDMGFPQADSTHLLLRDKSSSKRSRRESIETTHEIVLLMGDNLNDFSHIFEKKSISDRFATVDSMKSIWGSRFVVLPNPMYGDWEGAVYDYNWGASEAEKEIMRRKALRRK